jgi:hypothetical protein
MDAKLVPFMVGLTLLVLVGTGYAVYSFWRGRRIVAWNVVNAALTMRSLDAGRQRQVEQAAHDLLPGYRMTEEAFRSLAPAVRYALYSMAFREMGIAPVEASQPFRKLDSPYLARSSTEHIRFVRILMEGQHGVSLTELDPSVGGS